MDGKQYFSNFDLEDTSGLDPFVPENTQIICEPLAKQLDLIYRQGEIYFLGEDPAPRIVQDNKTNRTAQHLLDSFVAAGRLGTSKNAFDVLDVLTGKNNGGYIPDDSLKDYTEGEEVLARLGEENIHLAGKMSVYSLDILGGSIADAHRGYANDPDVDSTVNGHHAITAALPRWQNELLQFLRPWRGTITIHQDAIDHQFSEFSAEVNRGGNTKTYRWINEETDRNGPIANLCATVQELETLIALTSWVVQRGLAHLPILTPPHFETGYIGSGRKNPHADILLCGINRDVSDIVPIQVKRRASAQKIEEYIDSMVFLEPVDIGIVSQTSHPVRDQRGVVKTGVRTTFQYGHILDKFIELATASTNGKKPSRQKQGAFRQSVEPAFGAFDEKIGLSLAA